MKWSKMGQGKVLSFMQLFLHNILLVKIFLDKLKYLPSHFGMPYSKSWHKKTETKNVKGAKMVGFLSNCEQHPHKFNSGHFFCSLVVFSLLPFSPARKILLPSG